MQSSVILRRRLLLEVDGLRRIEQVVRNISIGESTYLGFDPNSDMKCKQFTDQWEDIHTDFSLQRLLSEISWNRPLRSISKGAVHKVRHARGGRGSEKVWQFVTEGGRQEHVTSRL